MINTHPKGPAAARRAQGYDHDHDRVKHLEQGIAVYRALGAALRDYPEDVGRIYEARHAVTEWEVRESSRGR